MAPIADTHSGAGDIVSATATPIRIAAVVEPEGITMPFSTLDPNAGRLVDPHNGVTAAYVTKDSTARSAAPIEALRRNGLPSGRFDAVGSSLGGTDHGACATHTFLDGWTEVFPVPKRQSQDIALTTFTCSAFSDTGINERGQNLCGTQVAIVCIFASSGVESIAQHARERGLPVTRPVDARADAARDTSPSQIFPRIDEAGSTEVPLQLLESARR